MIEKIYEVLRKFNYPVKYLLRPAFDDKNIVISFHFFNERYAYYGDGEGKNFEKNIQVDIFYKSDIANLDRLIIDELKKLNIRFEESFESEDSLSGIRLYHKVLRFYFFERSTE